MTNILVSLFIKDKDNVTDPSVRQAYGTLGGFVGIACNGLLFFVKLLSGIITGSISIIADAFNNLSDAASSIVTLIGFRIAGKPADDDHPFGHGRAEYLSGVVVAALIMLVGYELFKSSLDKILHPSVVEYTILSVGIMLGSILLKFWMMKFNKNIGKKINSSTMQVTAIDSLSDCIVTGVVILGVIINKQFGIQVDGYVGIVVAVFVFIGGLKGASDTLHPLLGKAPEEDFVREIEETVLVHEEVLGMHDLVVHDYGPGRIMVSLHAELPQSMDIIYAHEVIDHIEYELKCRFHCEVTIHLDPVAVDDELTNDLRKEIEEVVIKLEPELSIHDFRMTQGKTHMNLIFDVQVPFQCKLSNQQIKQKIVKEVRKMDGNYYAVIHIDRGFI